MRGTGVSNWGRRFAAIVMLLGVAACAQQQSTRPAPGSSGEAPPQAPQTAAPPEAVVLDAPVSRAPAPQADAVVVGSAAPVENARLFFLRRADPEPERAVFYGYLAIGSAVTRDKRIAVFRGVGCSLYVVEGGAAEADQIDGLGVVTLPTNEQSASDTTDPNQLLQVYDAPRADRWIAAAAKAAATDFDAESILFIGSTTARAGQMDALRLPNPNAENIVIADASDLNAGYLARWSKGLVDGVRGGVVKSRQDFQSLMEFQSWAADGVASWTSVFRIAPQAQAATSLDCPI